MALNNDPHLRPMTIFLGVVFIVALSVWIIYDDSITQEVSVEFSDTVSGCVPAGVTNTGSFTSPVWEARIECVDGEGAIRTQLAELDGGKKKVVWLHENADGEIEEFLDSP